MRELAVHKQQLDKMSELQYGVIAVVHGLSTLLACNAYAHVGCLDHSNVVCSVSDPQGLALPTKTSTAEQIRLTAILRFSALHQRTGKGALNPKKGFSTTFFCS